MDRHISDKRQAGETKNLSNRMGKLPALDSIYFVLMSRNLVLSLFNLRKFEENQGLSS